MLARVLVCLVVTAMASPAAAGSLPDVVQPQASMALPGPTCRTAPGGEAATTCAVALPASALQGGALVLHVTVADAPRACSAAQVLEFSAPEHGAFPIVHGAGGEGRKPACHSALRPASSANAAP